MDRDPRSEKEKRFDRIYQEYEKDVYRMSLSLVKNEQIAMDIAHQVFLNTYRHLDDIEEGRIRNYLFRSVTNTTYNYFRSEKRFVDEEEIQEASIGTTESPEEQYFQKKKMEQREELCHRILENLDLNHEKWKKILDMLYVQQIDSAEVAKAFGMNADALYSQMYRIRKWVHQKYGDEYDEIMY